MTQPAASAAVLTVDLGAIVANWRALGARHPSGPIAAVVKADAYGLGAGPIGRTLRDAGCGTFFVAQLGEGLALRDAVGRGPVIAVLNGFAPGADGGAGLVPVLNTLGDVDAHAAAGRGGAAWPAMLHVDTGMARLGLDAAELDALAGDPGRLAGLRVLHVMTHLACADAPGHPLNAMQAARFVAACARLPAMARSFANSSGIFLGPAFGSDLARPGCALYGINPTPGAANPMRAVVRLDVPVLQIREVPAGASVGYGAGWVAGRPSRVATVAAGYADGYLRALSGRADDGPGGFAAGSHGGAPLPLIGRVSMDLITLDATDHPTLCAGDRVTLLGGDAPDADALAAGAGTIGYEILTALGARYRRHYLPAARG